MNTVTIQDPSRKVPKILREGFTTGTAASAAAAAALHMALSGQCPEQVPVALPPFESGKAPYPTLSIAILRGGFGYGAGFRPADTLADAPQLSGTSTWAEVEKDGGDDPDATKHAHIVATVEVLPFGPATAPSPQSPLNIVIDGGEGVGRVTLPGLPMPVGSAAINPVPRQQITCALHTVARAHNFAGSLRVCIAVPEGEKLARHTLNARLGIVGGISILGTQGTVKPFSHAAWKATIVQGLNVAQQSRCPQICLSTGRRSEKLLMGLYPHLPAQAFIQAADFAKFSLVEAGQRPFSPLVWGCFFGKLLKLAEGHPYTHARTATLDMRVLSAWCKGLICAPAVARCVTAGHALEYLLDDAQGMDIIRQITQRAALHAQGFAGTPVRVHLFHIQGQELCAV